MKLVSYLFLILLGALGCAAQAGPHYQGEPLATLHGSIVTQGSPPPQGTHIAILYPEAVEYLHPDRALETWSASRFRALGVPIALSSSDPARFTLDIYEPPPIGALGTPNPVVDPVTRTNTLELPKYGMAYVVALAPDTNIEDVQREDILGVSLDHTLIYFSESDLEEDNTFVASFKERYQVPGIKGYHLSKVYPLALPERAAERQVYHECFWADGLCLQSRATEATAQVYVLDYHREAAEWNFNECMKRTPPPEACIYWYGVDLTPEQDAEREACRNKFLERYDGPLPLTGGLTPLPDEKPSECFPPVAIWNDRDLDSPVTITFGATLLDARIQVE